MEVLPHLSFVSVMYIVVKQSHYRPGQALKVLGFQDSRNMEVLRLLAQCTGRIYPQEIFLVLICLAAEDYVN
jgi:hypothetical protein